MAVGSGPAGPVLAGPVFFQDVGVACILHALSIQLLDFHWLMQPPAEIKYTGNAR